MADRNNSGPQQWGLTPPVSMDLPTPEDLKFNEALIAELKAQDNFESAEDTEKRKQVLSHFQRVTEEFVKDVGRRKGLAPSVVNQSGGKVSTFGSYRLGVYGPGSDIDTLLVAPKHVTRDDFFEFFPAILESMSPEGAIQENTPVPDAHVPIMKMEYSGISIDLIFVRLALSAVPLDIDLKDNNLLRGLEEVDLRSINGVRVTDEILTLVPQVKSFRQALRAIKLWAQRRAIYSNISGFPGGVAWAMMVARVCQLYPMAIGAVIVSKFFHIMGGWRWPQPVQLKAYEKGPLEVREWNPKVYPPDRKHIMPIITPAFPSMCATNNITLSTKHIIQKEMSRAQSVTNDIFAKKVTWKKLFEKHTFFTDGYKYYLSIISASRTKEAQQMWSGLVQSKVRRLVGEIENSETGVGIAHPYIKGFDRVHQCQSETEVDMILHGEMRFLVKSQTKETPESIKHVVATLETGAENAADMTVHLTQPQETRTINEDGTIQIFSTTYYIGLELNTESVNRKLDISNPVALFKQMCISWPQYMPQLNSLCTIHVRSYDLPEDVFGIGEKRPSKVKRSKGPKAGKGSNTQGNMHTTAYTNGSTPMSGAVPSKKRALESEGVELNDAKRRQSSNMVTPTVA